MGTTQSIFYPDNQYRLKRAQQLANDCKYAQQQYTASKARIENTLGPYKEKLDKLLQAFGCENIDELDRLVLRTATGDALEHWNRVRKNYDTSQIFDQVIMGAEAVVTIAGLAVSTVGALAGGIGFFAGLGITMDALLVLGVIGALYDIINGAVQRDKLRSAIDKLIPARLEAKYAQVQMEELESTIPTIQTIYHTYEELGFDKNKIMYKFKDHTWLNSLRTGSSAITYRSVGEELSVMDYSRKSWTNEDMDWHAVANTLQWKLEASSKVPSVAAYSMSIPNEGGCGISVASMAGFATQPWVLEQPQGNSLEMIPGILASHNMTESSISQGIAFNKTEGIPTVHDGEIMMKLVGEDIVPILSETFHVKLRDFETDDSAQVFLYSGDDKRTLVADPANRIINWVPGANAINEWTLRFVHPADALDFATTGPNALNDHPDSAEIYIHMGDTYVTRTGSLTRDSTDPAVVFVVSYA